MSTTIDMHRPRKWRLRYECLWPKSGGEPCWRLPEEEMGRQMQSVFMAKHSPQTHSWRFFRAILLMKGFWRPLCPFSAIFASILTTLRASLLVPCSCHHHSFSLQRNHFSNQPGVQHTQFERKVSKQGVKQGERKKDSCCQNITGLQIPFPLLRKSNPSIIQSKGKRE